MRLELLAISLSFAAILSSCENEERLSSDLINISATASSVKSDAETLLPAIEFEVTEYDFGTITAGRKYLENSNSQIIEMLHFDS